MLKKIDNEINDFTNNIKEIESCDKLLTYMKSDFFSSIKLLILASKTFSLYGRISLFLVIASAGLLISSIIGALLISSSLLLAITLFLFVLILIYISNYRKLLIVSIEKSKSIMKKSENSNE